MTIHKSQGSEFNHVLLALPENYNPVLCKELIYTGVTRAKQQVTIVAKWEVFKQSVLQKVERVSGLQLRL
jgi:exodeoxyribonuclease V alpha subunit